MARIGQVAVVGGDDGTAVVRKEVIIDPETGLLIEVQHIKAAVDIGGGDIAVREQKKIRVIGVAPQTQSRPAIQSRPATNSSRSRSSCSIQ